MKEILPAIPLPDNYKLNEAFSDDFDGDRLDESKWNPLCPWFLGRLGAFYFDPGNVAVKDGLLRLSARMPERGSAPLQHRLTHSDRFSTAFVQSRERIRYGYFETRCRCMKANVCNAFWLHDPLDPPAKWLKGDFSEEIDIFEVFGNPAAESRRREYLMTIHKFSTLYIDGSPVKVQNARVHKGSVIAQLEGVSDVNAAMLLKNKVVHIRREDANLPEGAFFLADIIGLDVVNEAGEKLGILKDILSPSRQQVYVVEGERQILIPAVPEFILETNVEAGYIKVRLIEGM